MSGLGGAFGAPPRPRGDNRLRRRWAAAGIGAEVGLLALLTLWLFPSIWAVLVAVVDIDQSAGPDIGIVLSEVANHPEAMWGETVTISAEVDRLRGPDAMIIGNDAFVVGDKVLVVAPAELTTLLDPPSSRPLRTDDVARVTGAVRPFDVPALEAALGTDLDDAALADYDGAAALVAEAIDLNPPEAIGPGDKEFAAGSSGYEIGLTINDLVARTDDYLGQVVTVSDEVEERLLTPHAFLLGDEALLVVTATPRRDLFVEATAYVTGEVRRFDLAEVEAALGVDLDDEALRGQEGEPVVVARSIEVVA